MEMISLASSGHLLISYRDGLCPISHNLLAALERALVLAFACLNVDMGRGKRGMSDMFFNDNELYKSTTNSPLTTLNTRHEH